MSTRGTALSARMLLTVLLLTVIAALAVRQFVFSGESHLVESKRTVPVLGTFASLIVIAPEESVVSILGSMDSLARYMDDELGFYGSGELSRVNSSGLIPLDDLSGDLRHLLDRSLFVASVTDSLFDPVMGNVVDAWGFPHEPAVPDTSVLIEAMESSTLSNLSVSRDTLFLLSGARLDFGAIAKGYVVDRLYELAMSCGASAVLVEIGGEIRCGSTSDVERTWRIALRDPRSESFRDVISIQSGSVATSGDYESFLLQDGRRLCHIIDPRTGFPQMGVASVTVVGYDCETSDALATAISVGGIETASAVPDSLFRTILVIVEEDDGSLFEWSRGQW